MLRDPEKYKAKIREVLKIILFVSLGRIARNIKINCVEFLIGIHSIRL